MRRCWRSDYRSSRLQREAHHVKVVAAFLDASRIDRIAALVDVHGISVTPGHGVASQDQFDLAPAQTGLRLPGDEDACAGWSCLSQRQRGQLDRNPAASEDL